MGSDSDDSFIYHNEAYFNETDPEDYMPPWLDKQTWVDPSWNWFDKTCKRLTPHLGKMVFSTTILGYGYMWPIFYEWYHRYKFDFSDNEGDDDDE